MSDKGPVGKRHEIFKLNYKEISFFTYHIDKNWKNIRQHILLVKLWGNRTSYTLLMGIQITTTLLKRYLAIPNKITHVLAFNPTSLLLGIYLEDTATAVWKYICTSLFIAVLFLIARHWEKLKCSYITEWLIKLRYTHIVEYCEAIKERAL